MQTQEPLTARPLTIQLLGGCTLSFGKCKAEDSSGRTSQLWNLLEYLIVHRHSLVTQEALISSLWPQGNSENPANALKNLVYRIRSLLSEEGFAFAKDLILFQNGSYRWNNDIPCKVDIEEFSSLAHRASQQGRDPRIRIALYEQAIQLYRGDFLPRSAKTAWTSDHTVKYHKLYLECVSSVVRLLESEKRFLESENICKKALLIAPYDEPTQQALILALLGQKKHQQALESYQQFTQVLFQQLGKSPSASFRLLYHEISKSIHDVEADLALIQEDLQEAKRQSGAYFCGYEVLKEMYRVEARSSERSGQTVFIGLFTLVNEDGTTPETSTLLASAPLLEQCLRNSLRRGDVFARYSSSQYVLLLPTANVENGHKVMDRVVRRFLQESSLPTVFLITGESR